MSEFDNTESWFDTDVDDIPDDPNNLPNNTYHFRVISAKLAPTANKDKTGITFKYQIVEGAYSSFFPLVDWVRVPDAKVPKDERQRMLSYLKMRLLAFGYTPAEIQKFGPKMVNDCVNREFYGTTSSKKDGDRTNIKVVKFDPMSDNSQGIDIPDDF
jgi:hypothetical protein